MWPCNVLRSCFVSQTRICFLEFAVVVQDPATTVACVPQTPFVIVGCESGTVRVIKLSSSSLKLTDYVVAPEEVYDGEGTRVVSLMVQYTWGDPVVTRMLIGCARQTLALVRVCALVFSVML